MMSDDFGKKRIFMGAGDHSLAYMGYLHSQLEKAFVMLGGIQQPPSCHEPEEACRQHQNDVWEGEYSVECIAKEICIALTGKEPNFEPYPPPKSAGSSEPLVKYVTDTCHPDRGDD